jgi:polysaccharide biosynthesis PFTS motif protein
MPLIQYIKLIKFSNSNAANKLHVKLDEGYRIILKSKSPIIDQLIREICKHELETANQYPSRIMIGNLSLKDLSLYKSQVVTNVLFNSFYFNRAISFYYAKNSLFVFPIKKEWEPIFETHGIEINRQASRIMWKIFISAFTIKNLSKLVRNLLFGFFVFKSKSTYAGKNLEHGSVYFPNLGQSNISFDAKNYKNLNFVNWYTQNVARDSFANVHHNIADLASSKMIGEGKTNVLGCYHRTLFFDLSFRDCIKSLGLAIFFMLKFCLKKNECLLVLFNLEGCIASVNSVSHLKCTNLKTVVFNSSVGSIKPLWAIGLERNNVFIDYCFYAMHSEALDELKYKKTDGLWLLASWSRYFVFDELQKQELRDQISTQAKIEITKVLPWWSDTNFEIPELDKPAISLFDSALPKQFYIRSPINHFGWGSPEIALTYLRVILELAEENNFKVFYKNKRAKSIEMRNDEHFYGVKSLLGRYKNSVIEIDERVAPIRVIEKSFLTISKPFSTTAVLAESLRKPSVYFDPTGKVSSSDPSARGSTILKNKQELNQLIKNLLANI